MKELIEIGRKYYPYINITRKKVNGGRGKVKKVNRISLGNYLGCKYSAEGLEVLLIITKLRKLKSLLSNSGIEASLSLNNSLYFSYKGKKYRISDHECNRNYDFSYIITIRSNEDYLFNMIINH